MRQLVVHCRRALYVGAEPKKRKGVGKKRKLCGACGKPGHYAPTCKG